MNVSWTKFFHTYCIYMTQQKSFKTFNIVVIALKKYSYKDNKWKLQKKRLKFEIYVDYVASLSMDMVSSFLKYTVLLYFPN